MKNIFGKAMLLATALLFSITGTSCSSDDSPVPEKEKTYDMSGFAKGADVSWLTEMEQDGVKFYNRMARQRSACGFFATLVQMQSAFACG